MPEITIEVTEEEKAILQEVAGINKMTLLEFCRQMFDMQILVCRDHLKADCRK